jgi:GNAT superfamily N-acetyltransferase
MRAIEITHRYAMQDGNGEVIAHVEVADRAGIRWLTNLWTHLDHRRQGYANALIETAMGEWQDRDLYLAVQPYTDQALDPGALALFYRSYGFVATSVPGIMLRPAQPWIGRTR